MKAITLHQPWASLVLIGAKQYETRSWPTTYRGQLAIHAGKEEFKGFRAWELSAEIRTSLEANGIRSDKFGSGFDKLPLGKVLGIGFLGDCLLMTEQLIAEQSEQELALGHWEPGRFAWRFDAVVMFDEPIPARGMQGIWNWDTSHDHVGMTGKAQLK